MEGEEWVRAGAQRRNEECVGGGDSWKKCCGLEGGLQGGQDGGASEGHTSTANSSAAWKEDSNENDRRRPRVTDVMVPRRYKAITMPPILRMRVTILGISVDNRSITTITPGIRTVAAIVLRHRPAMINKSTCNVENTNSENSNLSTHANTCFEARAGAGMGWEFFWKPKTRAGQGNRGTMNMWPCGSCPSADWRGMGPLAAPQAVSLIHGTIHFPSLRWEVRCPRAGPPAHHIIIHYHVHLHVLATHASHECRRTSSPYLSVTPAEAGVGRCQNFVRQVSAGVRHCGGKRKYPSAHKRLQPSCLSILSINT